MFFEYLWYRPLLEACSSSWIIQNTMSRALSTLKYFQRSNQPNKCKINLERILAIKAFHFMTLPTFALLKFRSLQGMFAVSNPSGPAFVASYLSGLLLARREEHSGISCREKGELKKKQVGPLLSFKGISNWQPILLWSLCFSIIYVWHLPCILLNCHNSPTLIYTTGGNPEIKRNFQRDGSQSTIWKEAQAKSTSLETSSCLPLSDSLSPEPSCLTMPF